VTISHLRPDPRQLGEEWVEIVEAEYEQVERLREWRNTDYYQPIANQFTDDPWRSNDEILDALRSFGRPDSVWLDIGAGGGRYALPLSLTSKRVIAVDPSSGMRDALRGEIERHGFQNIEQLDLRWPEGSDGIEADLSLAAHVGYDIRNINEFIDGMERATRERCIVLMMDRAPSGGFDRLWEQVHGEPRMRLPAMREYVHLLLARGAAPEIRNFPREREEWTPDSLLVSARRRLWLVEGSEKDMQLQELLQQEGDAGVTDYQTPEMISMIVW
jgi:SAM-dependent methyltransferase